MIAAGEVCTLVVKENDKDKIELSLKAHKRTYSGRLLDNMSYTSCQPVGLSKAGALGAVCNVSPVVQVSAKGGNTYMYIKAN